MTMNPENTFRTSDLALCAALCVSGFVVNEIEKVSFQRSVFLFKDSADLRGVVDEYWRKALRIEPQDYFNQLKVLKARIYER